MTTKTYWLSFCDTDRPKGQQFLGVSVIDVSEADVLEAQSVRPAHDPWIGAAIRKSWLKKCNPGGEVLTCQLETGHELIPRDVLLAKSDLERLGLIEGAVAN